MKKSYGIITALGVMAVAVAIAATRGSVTLKSYADTLSQAGSLKVTYTNQMMGGVAESTTLTLSKPNMARIDRADQLIVADGKKITTYDKKGNIYYSKDQTEAEFNALFTGEDLQIFTPFFKSDAFAVIMDSAKDNGVKTRKGMKLNVVDALVDSKSGKQGTLYFSNDDKLIRQAEFKAERNGMSATSVLNTTSISIGEASSADVFAFTAPDGSKEVSMSELMADKWYHDLDEAKKAAAASGRLIMLDFYAEWCGPCKMLMRDVFPTEEFKAQSKYFVFCKIDVDLQPAIAQQYGIEAMPTIKFIKADGTVVHEFLGYRPTAEFIAEMEKAKGAN